MSRSFLRALLTKLLCLVILLPVAGLAQQVDPSLYGGLRWRMIGPFRGGRSIAVSGVPNQPNVYYFGAVGGGVWKTTNSGETWEPIFDSQPIASIGALAVAPSNPNIIYVGTGEADFRSDLTYGNGMYKSTDAGKSWTSIGLRASRHIARILIDPGNPDIVLVAALGEAYGPSAERGVYRSTDGGANWQRVLSKDENTGAIELAADPDNFQTLYAALLNDRRPPWSTYPPSTTAGAIYKSTDSGVTWKQITGGGLPEGDWGRVGIAVARGTQGRRVYALIDAKQGGVYRSDDAGQTWTRAGTDRRLLGRLWYFGEISVDPKDPDTIYVPHVSIYRSTDAGKTFVAIKGAPGGDDYHQLWINPTDPARMIFGSDQGVGVSVDGGKTWTSWYNQPTAQMYHVSVDNQFPYHVYGAQQDSGSIVTTSRSDEGSITFRDWHQAGAGESGYVVPDPTDPNITYGGSTFGELFRIDKRTGQAQDIAPEPVRTFGDPTHAKYRFTWTSPIAFSPQEPHVLYFGSQYLLKSADQGMSWEKISPDLTGADPNAPSEGATTVENAKKRGHGVIYTIAPSPLRAGQIWVGTDTGLIQLTRDGGATWDNITPTGLSDWSKISLIEASRFDAGTAYAAVDRHRLSDYGAFIYRTHDYGKTWTRISAGIPDGAYVRAVREDAVRRGLLFTGTELGVYFSLDDGDHWLSLQLNMPITPVHDLVVKDNDLVVATHGRSFWILDDFSPLRQLSSDVISAPAHLFQPATAMRVRASTNHDTPLPPEVPAGENPPPGAILYYYLKSQPHDEVKLEILDARGQVIRAFSSSDRVWSPPAAPPFPAYWFKPSEPLSRAAGMHRFIWDLRHTPPSVPNPEYSMSTVAGSDVPRQPQGPRAVPGRYQIRLTVDGKSYTRPLKLVMDPRVKASLQDLEKQFVLQGKLSLSLQQINVLAAEVRAARNSGVITEQQEAEIIGARRDPSAPPPAGEQNPTLAAVSAALTQLLISSDSADAAPTTQQQEAAAQALAQMEELITEWQSMQPGSRKK